ncbi:hypothetical protein Tco_1354737 [Tanacetum coccineum]
MMIKSSLVLLPDSPLLVILEVDGPMIIPCRFCVLVECDRVGFLAVGSQVLPKSYCFEVGSENIQILNVASFNLFSISL